MAKYKLEKTGNKLNDVANLLQYYMNKDAFDKKTPEYGTVEFEELAYLPDGAPQGNGKRKSAGNPNHRLDVILPNDTIEKRPVIVMVHGGGYVSNRKICNRHHGMWLASHGYAVVNAEYTLVPAAPLAEEISELTSVFVWVADHADEYGFDMENLFLMGDSSGGHLVLLLTALQNRKDLQEALGVQSIASATNGKTTIRATQATCPVGLFYDRSLVANALKLVFRLLAKDGNDLSVLDARNFIDKTFPEVLIVTAYTDIGIHTVTKHIHKYMKKEHIAHEYKSYLGKTHILPHVFNVLNPEWEESKDANNLILEFFEKKKV